MVTRGSVLLAASAVAGTAWANGYPVVDHATRNSGVIAPITPQKVAVVREDLEVEIKDLRVGHRARIHAAYHLRNDSRKTAQLSIVFPVEDVLGYPRGGGHPRPSVTLDGTPLEVTRHWHGDLSEDQRQRLRQYSGRDNLFLNVRTGDLYPRRPSLDLPGAFLRFDVALQPRRTHHLIVEYWQRIGLDVPTSYQLTYLMRPARYWESWGETHITVRVPRTMVGRIVDGFRFGPPVFLLGLTGMAWRRRRRGVRLPRGFDLLFALGLFLLLLSPAVYHFWGEHIAISPEPDSHIVTPNSHIYRIHLGRPDTNLHVAIDPPWRVRPERI